MSDSPYLIVQLGELAPESNAILAKAASAGYATLVTIYVTTGPTGTGTAFAVLSK